MSIITMDSTNFNCLMLEVTAEIGLWNEAVNRKLITLDENGYVEDNSSVGLKKFLVENGVEFSSKYIPTSDDMSSEYFAKFDSDKIIQGFLNGLTKNDLDAIVNTVEIEARELKKPCGIDNIDKFNISTANMLSNAVSKLRGLVLDLVAREII